MEKLPGSASQSASLDFSLESLNKLNHIGGGGLYPDTGSGVHRGRGGPGQSTDEPSSSGFANRPGVDPAGSLSDSLYDSFSSCTSQGSNGV